MSSVAGYTSFPRLSFYCASKSALISLYDTLRMELGKDISITIVAPGVIESEMTKGKHFTSKGNFEVNQDLHDTMLGLVPVEPVKDFAKNVMNQICSGAHCIIEPGWWYGLCLYRAFLPEVVDWSQRLLYTLSPDSPATSSITNKLLNHLPFVRNLFHMHLLQSPEIKRE